VVDAKADSSPGVHDKDFVALPVGTVVGRYRITAVLGRGGFGITYVARDAQLGREVAIKEYLPTALAIRHDGLTVLPSSTNSAEDFAWGRQRFVDEGRTLASLQRAPAIVRVHDFLEANGTAYIVMELAPGSTLEHRLKNKGPLSPPAIDAILWPLLDGLTKVHDAGFLHRDIKPANILVDEDGHPTLIDFGASRAAMAGRTAAMTAIFTPGYAAAEQMTSAKQGPWTDIYGLSATLYHAITGAAPASAFDRMLDDSCVPLAQSAPPGFGASLLAGIDAGLSVRAGERPQSIAAWRTLLTETSPSGTATIVMPRREPLKIEPAQMGPAARATTASPVQRSRFMWAAVVAAIVLVGVGSYVGRSLFQGPAVQSMTAEELTRALAERQKADVAAAEKKKLEEEAQRQADADANAKKKADEALAAAQQQRQKAEEDLAKLKAEMEARQKAEAAQREAAAAAAQQALDEAMRKNKAEAETAALRKADEDAKAQAAADAAAKQQADAEAQRKAEAAAAASRQAEEDAHKKAAAEAETQRKADEALAKAQAERQRADEAAARQKADLEARQKADADANAKADADAKAKADAAEKARIDAEAKAKAEADAAAEKKAAETAENGLKLAMLDRQHLQVALTTGGFDTHGSDGAFGPRSREMIAAWQKAHNQPATGFLNAAQEQVLLKDGAAAITRYDDDQKKIEDDKKKADEEAKKKAADEAAARAAVVAPSPPAAAVAPSPPAAAVAPSPVAAAPPPAAAPSPPAGSPSGGPTGPGVTRRVVRAGVETVVATHGNWDGNCETRTLPTVEVVSPPQHGTVSVRATPTMAECGKTIQATGVFYTPNPGFTGSDRLSYNRLPDASKRHPGRSDNTQNAGVHTVNVEVR